MDVKYSKKAVKIINRLDSATKQRIHQAILNLPEGDVKKLTDKIDSWRLRVGDWRILFSYPDENVILIEKIGPRGQIYKEN